MAQDYNMLLDRKRIADQYHGFSHTWMPDTLFDFQKDITSWAIRKGRAAIFADCGLGKTLMQLVWAENVVRHTNKPVLILAPLAVGPQTQLEGNKIGVSVSHRRDGIHTGDMIVVTNYERLQKFYRSDYAGVVCDESSILKAFDGSTRQAITDFMSSIQYRLLCTATAAPNDYMELGTSAEALGVMKRSHMLTRFFVHDGGDTAKWRLKGHAREHTFWKWVTTWARSLRKPSDVGYDDGKFVLPYLNIVHNFVTAKQLKDGCLFDAPAVGLDKQRKDLRRTITERCEKVSEILNSHDRPSVAWCNLNDEGNLLERIVSGSVNVEGSDKDDVKEEAFTAFAKGKIRCIISKPSIAGFGMNWQHCADMTYFPTHSYEQYYQAVRRCWRFGQHNQVNVNVILTDGLEGVLSNMERKAASADHMFDQLVSAMQSEMNCSDISDASTEEVIPQWLS